MENVRKILEERRVPFDIIRHKQPIRSLSSSPIPLMP